MEREDNMRITVFTPAYNRGNLIERLYRSLQRQTFTDFEWVVVDDGSTDDTEVRFARFCREENKFPIRYVKTKNGGKHRAINCGLKMAAGDLFFIVDSDDYLTDDALEGIDLVEKSIPEDRKTEFCGVCGLKSYENSSMIGQSFSGEYLDITVLERKKYGITGDKSEVFYTSILQRYPFPEFEGERFMTECVVWDKIAADGYKMRFYNRISTVCNYLEDGLTSQGGTLFQRNPKGYGLYLYQSGRFGKLSKKEKWEAYLSYFYELHDVLSFSEISKNLHINPMVLWLRLLPMRILEKIKKKV